jgi:pimeloyl-ACP methyl ester carboxylesterase
MPKHSIEPGLTIHYQDYNNTGTPGIVLLHGLGANCDSWQLQIPALIDAGYHVVVPDMRGFGQSSYPGGRNNPRIMAGDIAKLLEGLSLAEIHLVGISLGGTVALEMIIAKPELIKSLVITNSFAKLRPKKFSLWFFYAIRMLLVHLVGIETQADYVADRLFPDPGQEVLQSTFNAQICQSNPSGYRSTMRSLAFFDVSKEVSKINKPTLIITGENDTVVPPKSQNELANLIPGSEQKIIKDAGHAVTVEKPGEYNLLLLDFLSKHEQSKIENS